MQNPWSLNLKYKTTLRALLSLAGDIGQSNRDSAVVIALSTINLAAARVLAVNGAKITPEAVEKRAQILHSTSESFDPITRYSL